MKVYSYNDSYICHEEKSGNCYAISNGVVGRFTGGIGTIYTDNPLEDANKLKEIAKQIKAFELAEAKRLTGASATSGSEAGAEVGEGGAEE